MLNDGVVKVMKLGEDLFGLKDIWSGVFSVYTEFAKVCEANNLRYYVSDGSALGAVRHQGFIPWDDDFDVSMPRPDYEKFIEIADRGLPPYLKLVTWRNTPTYNGLFAKIQDSREEVVRGIEAKCGVMLSNGIYIDILPIDGTATSWLARFLADKWFRIRRVLMRFRLDQFSRQTRKGKLYWLAGAVMYLLFPWLWGEKKLLESYDKSARAHTYVDSELTIRPCSNVSYRRAPIKRSVWGVPTPAKFGDATVMLPEKCNEYLLVEYGDYMKLPPESKRHPSHQYSWRCPWWLGSTNQLGHK